MLSVSFLGINGSLVDRDGGNTSLLLRSPDLKILVDVSGNIAEAVDADIDSVIITHEHIDHVYGLVSLLHQLWLSGRERKLTVYGHEIILPLLESLVKLFSLREKKNFFPLTIEKAEDFRKGGTEVSFFPTDHTSSSFGFCTPNNLNEHIDKFFLALAKRNIDIRVIASSSANKPCRAAKVLLLLKSRKSAAEKSRRSDAP